MQFIYCRNRLRSSLETTWEVGEITRPGITLSFSNSGALVGVVLAILAHEVALAKRRNLEAL